MVSKTGKVIVIIACLSVGIIAILFAPILPSTIKGTETVQYNASITQINLIVDSDVANIYIDYSTVPTADLINLSYNYLVGYSILLSPPPPEITFTNFTIGNVLNVVLNIQFPELILSSVWSSITQLTINPYLLTNLTISCGTGNLDVDNSYSINKTFVDIDLSTSTGNIDVNLINESQVRGNLLISRETGNTQVVLGRNSNIDGNLQINSTTGNSILILLENATLNNDFIMKTTAGTIDAHLNNISLNNDEVQGIIQSTTGNLNVEAYQKLDLVGNLTLKLITSSGNVRLPITLEEAYLSSGISYQTSSGSIKINPNPPGFDPPGVNTMNSSAPDRSSNFDVAITTISGNIDIIATRE
ncbi:MAG: hypothetical protein ACTSQI_07510 [Candidatus Helarchaeota archaeon]